MNRPRQVHKVVVAASAASVLALAGCTQGSTTADPASGDTADQRESADQVSIRYTNFSANAGNEENLQAMIDAFEAEYPHITVEAETLPFGDYFVTLQTNVAGGTVGDTFELNFENFATYAAAGAIAPIGDVPEGVYPDSLIEGFQWEGEQLGLPLSYAALIVVYNRELFQAAGLDEPTSDWTWDDEWAAAVALTDSEAGIYGSMQSANFNEFYKALAQAGGQFLSDDGTRAQFNSPEGVTAADWLVEKYGTVMATEADGLGTPDFDLNLFNDGKLAMWHTGGWMFGVLADSPVEWDIAVEPAGPSGPGSGMFSNGVFISPTSQHPEEAKLWLEFLTGSDASVAIRIDASWELPPVSDPGKMEAWLAQSPPQNRPAVLESIENGVLPPRIVRYQEVADVFNAELNAARDGSKSIEAALADAESAVNALLAD